MNGEKPHPDLELARRLFPRVHFDMREPFFPVLIGVSLLDAEGPSPSFRRRLCPPSGGLVIEYAIYWDWDIQHLYDLEHIWLFLDEEHRIVDAEASFHGKFLKSLLPDGANLDGAVLQLWSQPGKHAFAPLPLVFRLLPDADSACGSEAGKAGAELPAPLQGRIVHQATWDGPVRTWLRRQSFVPSWDFAPWNVPPDCFVSWHELDERLPALFMSKLALALAGQP